MKVRCSIPALLFLCAVSASAQQPANASFQSGVAAQTPNKVLRFDGNGSYVELPRAH